MYSIDLSLIGIHTIKLEAYFVNYPAITSVPQVMSTPLEIVDPCDSPTSLIAPSQNDPAEYFYTPAATTFHVSLPLEVYPPVCPISFECVSVDGPDDDVACTDEEVVMFDAETGSLTF